MHSSWHASSMHRAPAVLIAAASGRALAASARRGGYAPLVADFFGDEDTATAAEAYIRLDRGLSDGMRYDRVITALERLATPREPAGIVCGTAFEARPELLPDIAKRPGGAGGRHIRDAADSQCTGGSFYFQRRVQGSPISALFLADGRRTVVLGFSAQWSAPTSSQPFRYGGAVQPAVLEPETAAAMKEAVQRLGAMVPLLGLNSADFLVSGDVFTLLEINPRPGATLDIFEPAEGSLFAMHVSACQGALPATPPSYERARAAAIVY